MEGVGPQMWLELRRVKMLTRSLRYLLENYHCFNIEGDIEPFHMIILLQYHLSLQPRMARRQLTPVNSPQKVSLVPSLYYIIPGICCYYIAN